MNCGLCERELHGDAAGYLCPGCTRATAERLARMGALYVALAEFLQPAARRPELGRTRPPEAPLPVAESVLTLRGPGGIVSLLEDWRSALHADLGWTEPLLRGAIEDRIATAARGLTNNLPWIASSWPAAGSFATELRDLERDITSIVNPPERSIRIGWCPAVYEDGVLCGAILRVLPGVADVHCRWCGAVYPPTTWYALADAQAAFGENGFPEQEETRGCQQPC